MSVIAKFCEETKMPKGGTKNALLGIFDQECLFLGIFGQEFKKSLLSYLKSAPSNLSICKTSRKNKSA